MGKDLRIRALKDGGGIERDMEPPPIQTGTESTSKADGLGSPFYRFSAGGSAPLSCPISLAAYL